MATRDATYVAVIGASDATEWELSMAEEVGRRLARAGAVLVCGGLGPTQDDITRDAIAAVLGVGLEHDEVVAERIRQRIEERFVRARTPVTISGGIAVFPDDAGAPADLIVQADAGRYGAAAAGKNPILLPQGERRRFRRLPSQAPRR